MGGDPRTEVGRIIEYVRHDRGGQELQWQGNRTHETLQGWAETRVGRVMECMRQESRKDTSGDRQE